VRLSSDYARPVSSLASVLLFICLFYDTPTPEIYPLSLHDALPILAIAFGVLVFLFPAAGALALVWLISFYAILTGVLLLLLAWRSEEHTSELQSRVDLVCRLLLEKKKQK